MSDYLAIFEKLDPPFGDAFDNAQLGDDFPAELQTASQMWVQTGYGQGIAAYLNFFLLKDFITTHDDAYPPRFMSFKSMADSFYQTDLFIRDVTDSGKEPTGGISNPDIQRRLRGIMQRHERLEIPLWMMTYFGFQLMEAVEHECEPLGEEDRQRHLSYFAKTYRIMGVPFSDDRSLLEEFARDIERKHAGLSPNLEKHARNILALGEMVDVRSDFDTITAMLPDATREFYAPIHRKVRPGFLKRLFLRAAGRVLIKRAIGEPREAVPYTA